MPRERPIINWDEVPVIIDVPYVARLLALNVDYTTRLAQRGVNMNDILSWLTLIISKSR